MTSGCTCDPCASCRMRLSKCCGECAFCLSLADDTGREAVKAFNDPTVECCGRDAADCDCPENPGWAAWRHNMDDALTAAFETLLWTGDCNGTVEHDDCRGEDCDKGLDDLGFTSDDFAPGAAREVEEDLHGFVTSCLAERPTCFDKMTADMVGYDFILTRQRQGVGFWDRGLGEMGDWLTKMAHPFGSQDAYIGDDGIVYVHG